MNSTTTWIATSVLFVILAVYSSFLNQKKAILSLELESLQSFQQGRKDVEASLRYNIERVEKLAAEVTVELDNEEKKFGLLQSTLANIQSKLESAEELESAVVELRNEYAELREIFYGRTGLK
jgi:hypothetical protein